MTKLIIIGGFLGSGKTTVILELAKRFLSLGQKVGIVTNDQGSELVDTEFLRANGLSVLEVTGGCFCCNFDEFTRKVEELAKSEMPDVILAEPVGSCT
ncbi:MAG: cobalamin synthesis protein P47K, partial [Clostridiales bacterium]|nr:cobalamin synthesis protein P47K [Clostridiales bacterium]